MSNRMIFFSAFLVLSLFVVGNTPLAAAENLIFSGASSSSLDSLAVFCSENCYLILKPLTWLTMLTLVGASVVLKKRKELAN